MIDWKVSASPVPYPDALTHMERRVQAIRAGEKTEQVWLLEHPPLYTAGTSADPADLLRPDRFPVFDAGRGGQYTYHGPGQRVAYTMLDVAARGRDIRKFVWTLEQWVVDTLADFGVVGERRDGRVGVWVIRPDGTEEKIAAIGIRLRRWVSFHGISINIDPDLSHFDGIVPCGIGEHGVTSLAALGTGATMQDVDTSLQKHFARLFPRADQTKPG